MIYVLLKLFKFSCDHIKKCIFKSSALLGIDTLLDESLRVLRLPTRLSKLTANG